MNYSVEWLMKQKNPELLFFWGHQPSKDGTIIKSCLSQWWPGNFKDDTTTYRTAEHYMMAKKAELFSDNEVAREIVNTRFPKDVKALGRQIRNFDSEKWDHAKFNIVKQGNYLKFSQNAALKQFLLETKNKVLVETSPSDAIWGIGLPETDPKATKPAEWRGLNLLGFALMEVRDELKNQSK
jgi:ribA/ribD-fused uncharacterized protein